MHFWYTVKFAHMTLRMIPEVFNTVNVIPFVCKEIRNIDSKALKFTYVKHITATRYKNLSALECK